MKIANYPKPTISAVLLGLLLMAVCGLWSLLVFISTATELPTGLGHFWNWFLKPALDLLNASYPSGWLLAGLAVVIAAVVLDRYWDRIPFRIEIKESPRPYERAGLAEALRISDRGEVVQALIGIAPHAAVMQAPALDAKAELDISFERDLNYTVHESGLAEARIWVWNRSMTAKAVNLHVKVESLKALTNKKKAQRSSMSFTNFDLHLERMSPGDSLSADSHVEVFVLRHPKDDPMLYFISGERGNVYQTPTASYLLTIRASSDNCPATRQTFKIGFSNGTMTFKKCDAGKKPSATGANKKMPQVRSAKFVGEWRIEAENGEPAFTLTLDKSFSARKSHVPTATGEWEVVGNEAHITWSDDWRDKLQPQNGKRALKIAFRPGTSWNDLPTNTQPGIKEV